MISDIRNAIAALLGFYGVAAGAAAAHAIADPNAADWVATAALYALVHAALLLGWREKGLSGHIIKWLFILGTVLFSGSITLAHGFAVSGVSGLAPVGGFILLLSWLSLAVVSASAAFGRKTAPAATERTAGKITD